MTGELASLNTGQEGEKSLWAVWEHPMLLLVLQGSGLLLTVNAKAGCTGSRVRRKQQNWFIKAHLKVAKISVGNTCSYIPVPCSPSPPFTHSPLSQTLLALPPLQGPYSCRAAGALESTGDLKRAMRCITFKVNREWMMGEGEQIQKSMYTHTNMVPDS